MRALQPQDHICKIYYQLAHAFALTSLLLRFKTNSARLPGTTLDGNLNHTTECDTRESVSRTHLGARRSASPTDNGCFMLILHSLVEPLNRLLRVTHDRKATRTARQTGRESVFPSDAPYDDETTTEPSSL